MPSANYYTPPPLHPSLDFAPLSRRQWRSAFLHATDFSFGRNKCIKQRDYQIHQCLIVLALCQSKEYAAIRFHRRGLLSPVSLQYQQTDFNLLGRANVCSPGYSFAFWLKNLQTQNDVFASASSGEHSFCTRIFKPKGEHPSYASHAL